MKKFLVAAGLGLSISFAHMDMMGGGMMGGMTKERQMSPPMYYYPYMMPMMPMMYMMPMMGMPYMGMNPMMGMMNMQMMDPETMKIVIEHRQKCMKELMEKLQKRTKK
ncbi:hypothetical protein [Aquifex aeolicus]|uniref:hypothetical protein n=1 Tax=Aquifex aeolicus TaxID=63363 RepID=UPI0002D4416B|nr:hypothetical protein [Aquifex aeolicus]